MGGKAVETDVKTHRRCTTPELATPPSPATTVCQSAGPWSRLGWVLYQHYRYTGKDWIPSVDVTAQWSNTYPHISTCGSRFGTVVFVDLVLLNACEGVGNQSIHLSCLLVDQFWWLLTCLSVLCCCSCFSRGGRGEVPGACFHGVILFRSTQSTAAAPLPRAKISVKYHFTIEYWFPALPPINISCSL